MAFSIARQEKLDVNDVIVISANYKLPIPFGKIIPVFSDTQKGWLGKISNLNVGAAFDKYLEDAIGDEHFCAYIDIMHTYQKLLVTHYRCKEFHFFEEGTDSYMLALTLEDFTRTAVSDSFRNTKLKDTIKEIIRSLRGYTSALHSLPYHPQSYQYDRQRKYYCLSKFCYPGVPNEQKEIVTPNFLKEELSILSSNMRINDSIVLVEETYPNRYGIADQEYKKALKSTLSQLNTANKNVYLKLRPNKKKQESKLMLLLNQLEVSYKLLPDTVLAEGVFLNSSNITVVGFVSSLLFYAKIFGHKGYSMMQKLKEKPSTRFDNINGFSTLVKAL